MPPDLDSEGEKRIADVAKKAVKKGDLSPADVFHCERVVETLPNEKIYLDSYRAERVLSTLPFCPITYVHLCARCVGPDEFDAFKKLVESGLVLPVLRNPYSTYPGPLSDFISAHDHISLYEYSFWRWYRARTEAEGFLCQDCADRHAAELCELIKGKRGAAAFRRMVEEVRGNLRPYIYPDAELLDAMGEALATKDVALAEHFVGLSEIVYRIRSSKAVGAPLLIDNEELSQLPHGVTSATDEARRLSNDLKRQVAGGLGITIPMDVPIDRLIELVKEFQPRITQISRDLSNSKPDIEGTELVKAIENLNREIERIKGLKRFAVLEAGMSLFHNNKELVVGGLIASALGLAGSFVGCAATIGTTEVVRRLRNKGKLQANEKVARLGRMISKDVQPLVDGVIARYLDTTPTAVGVVTIKKKIDAVKRTVPTRSADTDQGASEASTGHLPRSKRPRVSSAKYSPK